MEAIKELLQFLDLDARIDVKTVALQNILGLTGSPEGLELLSDIPELVSFPNGIDLPWSMLTASCVLCHIIIITIKDL